MQVNVKHHDLGAGRHVESIGLLHQSKDVIILLIDLKTKYKNIGAYGGATDEGVQSVWVGDDEIQMKLPFGFEHNQMFAEVSRYTIHLCIYRYGLLEEYSDSSYNDVVLWECEDD